MKSTTPSQADRILEYIREHGEITSFHAAMNMSIWRLPARINDLEKSQKIVVEETGFIGKTKNYRYKATVL